MDKVVAEDNSGNLTLPRSGIVVDIRRLTEGDTIKEWKVTLEDDTESDDDND